MRFILFNAVVAGALIYLFSGADRPGADARQTVDDAMARLAALGEQAVERVEKMQEDGFGHADAPAAAEPPTPLPEAAPPRNIAPQPQPSAAPDPVSEPAPRPEPAVQPAPVAEPANQLAAAPADQPAAAPPEPPQTAAAPLPEREIATVRTHRVPKPGDSEPVAAQPAKRPIEIAEPLMSSQDRRKELFSLAEEMELMYATRVHE